MFFLANPQKINHIFLEIVLWQILKRIVLCRPNHSISFFPSFTKLFSIKPIATINKDTTFRISYLSLMYLHLKTRKAKKCALITNLKISCARPSTTYLHKNLPTQYYFTVVSFYNHSISFPIVSNSFYFS